jgi:hypothetical protein
MPRPKRIRKRVTTQRSHYILTGFNEAELNMDEVPSPSGLSGTAMVVPIAAIGSLSQAWFDALGLARPRKLESVPAAAPAPKALRHAPLQEEKRPDVSHLSAKVETLDGKRKIAKQRVEFGATRIRAAEKMRTHWRVAQSQATTNDTLQRSAGRITIRTKHGVVRMLVQREDNRMRFTAVCDPAIVGSVHDALATARIRLAARGIDATLSTHEGYAA